jgi:hypothetical protein
MILDITLDILHAGVLAAGVQVSATSGPCLVAGTACRHEAAAAVAASKITPRLRAAAAPGFDLPCSLTIGSPAHVSVPLREDVARPQVLVEEVVERQLREMPPKSIITGTSASVPASTARSTSSSRRRYSGPP